MDVSFSRGRHCPLVRRIFGEDLDAFLREDVLIALFGDRWESVLCVDGDHAMLHAFVASPIKTTQWHDIEPYFGYAGPVFTRTTPGFIRAALKSYSAACRDRGIVCELIRFQPDRQNHLPLRAAGSVSLHEGRLIAYIPIVEGDDDAQLAVYSAACRRQVKSARKRLHFTRMEQPEHWRQFGELYEKSLSRNRAARRWYLENDCFERMRGSHSVSLWGVYADSERVELLSSSVVISARGIVHTLFVANVPPELLRGANDLLTHGIVRAFQGAKYRSVCLGGGRTSNADDSLLAFKRKFGPQHCRSLPLGLIVHDPNAFDVLCAAAAKEPLLPSMRRYATELPTRLLPYKLVARFADSDAVPPQADAEVRASAEIRGLSAD